VERKWWLVIAGCITHAVNTGFSYFGMSAFFPSFEREFGWSRTAISGAFSLARVESGLLGPIGRSSPAFSMTSPTATRLLSGYLRRLASARWRCCFWLNDRKRQLYRSGFRYRPGDASAPHAIFLRFSLWRTRLNPFQPKDTWRAPMALLW
jgi:hypothetical protein